LRGDDAAGGDPHRFAAIRSDLAGSSELPPPDDRDTEAWGNKDGREWRIGGER
jgi:hypothetical protein